jgi:hypothetical protein
LEEGIATSSCVEEFVGWIYNNGFVIFNQLHEFTFFHRNAAFNPTIIDLTFANAQSVGSDHCTLSWNIDKSLQEDFELETFSIKERKKEKWVDTFKSKMAVMFPMLRILHFFTSPFFTITTMWQIIKSQSIRPLTEMPD